MTESTAETAAPEPVNVEAPAPPVMPQASQRTLTRGRTLLAKLNPKHIGHIITYRNNGQDECAAIITTAWGPGAANVRLVLDGFPTTDEWQCSVPVFDGPEAAAKAIAAGTRIAVFWPPRV